MNNENEVLGGSPIEWGCESWADAVQWEADLEKIRPPEPWWAYKVAIARATGSPVGSRMAEVQGADDWQDARPVRDLFEAGATVGQAVAVLRVARDLSLWSRGYGSPYSPSAKLIWLALRRRWICPLDKQRTDASGRVIADPRRNIKAIVDAYGSAPTRLPYNALAIARVASALRSQFTRLLSNQQAGGWPSEYLLWAARQVAEGRVHFYAALSALSVAGRAMGGAGYWPQGACWPPGARVDRNQFRHMLWNEAKRPLHVVRREVASPKALWGLAGVKVARDVRIRPEGIKTGVVRDLLGDQGVPPGDDLVLPAVNLAKAYSREAARVVEVYQGDVHGAGQLPVVSAEAGAYVLRHLKVLREKAARDEDFHREVSLLHARWLPEMEKMAWSQAVKAARSQAYEGLAKELAVACSEAGLSEEQAAEYRGLWEGRKIPEVDELPDLRVHGSSVGLSGDWVFRRIPRNDPTGPLLGILTNCCQHPWGAGSSCARHGMESRYGGFYAVFYNGRIVAQSWAWVGEIAAYAQGWIDLNGRPVRRKERTLVFDNIEALSSSYQEGILALYRAAAALALDAGFSHVHVGKGYSGVNLDSLPTAHAVSPLDYSGYRDSHSQVRLASRSSMAHAMATLEAQIYPPQFQQGVEGFEHDLKDEERIGLVMLHGDRPVGYVMADVSNEDVEIEDLAVLPEYRGPDCLGKQPASHVLLAKLVEQVNSLRRGRPWTISGEARHFSARLHRHFGDLVEVIEEEPFYCPDRQENLVRFVYRFR